MQLTRPSKTVCFLILRVKCRELQYEYLLDVVLGQAVVLGPVLGHVLSQLDEPHAGQLLLLHAEELDDALVVLLVGVDAHKQDLALELGGQVAEGLEL